MLKRRTDLALEAAQLWQESAGEAGTLPGVESEEATREGYPVTVSYTHLTLPTNSLV